MQVAELVRAVRLRINDGEGIGFTDEELLDYVNMGVRWLHHLVTRERPELLAVTEEVKIKPGKLSKKAIRILEGPRDLIVSMDGGVLTEQRPPFSVKYVSDAAGLKGSDVFPYYTIFAGFVIELATVRAQARNEFDMSLEADLMGRLEQQILETLWGLQNDRVCLHPYYPEFGSLDDYGGAE